MSQASKGTLSHSFIFLKDITTPEDDPKKIIFPRTFFFLMKKAKELYGDRMDVRSFYDENGDRIRKIEEITPGGLLYVSSLDSNTDNNQANIQKPANSPSKDKGRIISTESYQQIFGNTMGGKIDDDKLPRNTGRKLKFSKTGDTLHNKESNNDESKKSRTRFVPKSERIQKEQQVKAEKEMRIKEMNEKSRQFDQIKARRTKTINDQEQNGSIKSMVNTVRRIPIPGQGKYVSQDDTTASPSNNKYNFYDDEQKYLSKSEKERSMRDIDINEDENQYEFDLDNDNDDSSHQKYFRNEKYQASNSINSRKSNQIQDNISQNNNINENEDKYYNRSSNDNFSTSNFDNQEEKFNENEKNALSSLFSETIRQKGAFSSNISKALEDLPAYSESLTKLPELELEQKCSWYLHEIEIINRNNIFPPVSNGMFGIDELVSKARFVIKEHRFITSGGLTHRLNLAIVGPNGSGKSTFLGILTDELLKEFVSTDEWKKTFLFFTDLTSLMSDTTEYSRFYHSIVEKTINCIESQKPELIPYIPMIKKHFDDVVLYRQPPKFPKNFMLDPKTQKIAYELQFLIDKYSRVWNDEEGLLEWITSIIYLPILVSKALGFQKFLYVLDHFDVGDVIIDPSPVKFSESASSVYLIDILKYILTQTNFIISCSDQQLLFALLEPNMEEERQVQKEFDYISMIDLIGEIPYADKQIYIETSKEKMPFIITSELCGGVPLYLDIWMKANQFYDQIESIEEEEEEEEDLENIEMLNDQLMTILQKAIKVFYVSDHKIDKYDITNYRRKTISAKSEASK